MGGEGEGDGWNVKSKYGRGPGDDLSKPGPFHPFSQFSIEVC